MSEENKKIKTPAGKELILKPYMTARDRNSLRSVYLTGMKIENSEGELNFKEIPGGVIEEAEKKLIEISVLSYDGSTEKIVDRLLDGKPEEYDFVVAEANKLGTGFFQKAK